MATTYGTPALLRVRINKSITTADAVLDTLLAAASLAVDNFCHRPEGFVALAAAAARTFTGSGKRYIYLPEFVAVTAVGYKAGASASSWTAWAATDYVPFGGSAADPDWQPLARGRPYDGLFCAAAGSYSLFPRDNYGATVQVTARWGFAATGPADIQEATMMQAARWYKRYEGAMADSLATGEFGQLQYVKVLDPDVQNILVNGRYWRPAEAGQ